MSNPDRKQAIRAFKERKVPQGIFAVRSTATGGTWADSSRNLDAARNSTWFQLRHGGHMNKSLQAEWNARGEDTFTFDILETLDDDVPALNLKDVLEEKKRRWSAKLCASC